MKTIVFPGRKPGKAAVGMTDGENVITIVTVDGKKRIKGIAPNSVLPNQNMRTSNITAYNSYVDAMGRMWPQLALQQGDVETHEDKWAAATWSVADSTLSPQFDIDEQDGPYGHKPRIIMLIDDGNGVIPATEGGLGLPQPEHAGLFLTAQGGEPESEEFAEDIYSAGGMILFWDGLATTIDNQTDTTRWLRRTETDDIITDGTRYGRGHTGSFHDGLGLRAYDPTVSPLFETYETPEDATSHNDSIGFGHYAYGWPMVLFFYSERWYCIARGFVVDKADDALDPESFQPWPVFMLWACNVGEDPTNYDAWANCIDVWSAFDVDNAYSELSGESATTIHTNFYAWPLAFGGRTYIYSNPIVPLTDVATDDSLISDDTAVRVLDGGGWHNSIAFSESDSYGGGLVSDGTHLYWVEISVSEQKLFVWRLESSFDHWSLRFSVTLGVDEGDDFYRGYIATAYYANGRIYVVWGRRPSIFNDAPIPATDGAGRVWQMATLRMSTGTWSFLSTTMPVQDFYTDSINGLVPRLIPTLPDVPDTGGGGGGGGGGTGPCDETYFWFIAAPGDSTITKAAFASEMAGSPILDEITANDLYDLIESKGVNVSFALAQMVKESQRGTVPGSNAGLYNMLNIRCHSWVDDGITFTCSVNHFCGYDNWVDGVTDYLNVCNLGIYAGTTISQFINLFAPPQENNTGQYTSQVCTRMATYASE